MAGEYLFVYLEQGSCWLLTYYVAEDVIELQIFLSSPSECWHAWLV